MQKDFGLRRLRQPSRALSPPRIFIIAFDLSHHKSAPSKGLSFKSLTYETFFPILIAFALFLLFHHFFHFILFCLRFILFGLVRHGFAVYSCKGNYLKVKQIYFCLRAEQIIAQAMTSERVREEERKKPNKSFPLFFTCFHSLGKRTKMRKKLREKSRQEILDIRTPCMYSSQEGKETEKKDVRKNLFYNDDTYVHPK